MNILKLTAAAAAIGLGLANVASATELKLATAVPPASPWGKFTAAYVDKVAELSGGALTINAFYSSELGDEQTTVRQVARGRIDMGTFSNTAISLLVPEFALMAAPFIYDSQEQADCVVENHISETFAGPLAEAGVVGLAPFEIGHQAIFSKTLFKTPADMAGVKVRTAPTIPDTLYIQTAGATAVPMGTVDTMPALKTGGVEAVTWPIVYGVAAGYAKEAPQVTDTRHVHQVGQLIVSTRTWEGLSDQEKTWLSDATVALAPMKLAVRGAQDALLGKVAAAGATVHKPTEDEIAAWRAVAPAAQEAIIKEMGGNAQSVWDSIVAAKAACGN